MDLDTKTMEAISELREEVKKAIPNEEKMAKINEFLDTQEEKNQVLVTSLAESKEREVKANERMEAIEAELSRGNSNQKDVPWNESDEYKALNLFCKSGKGKLEDEMKALLRTDEETSGGVLVMSEMDDMIHKNIVEVSALRSIARVRTIASKTLEVPRRTAILTATYEGERQAAQKSTSEYAAESITAFRQTVTVPITEDLLMDSAFDMNAEIMSDAGEAFAQGEGLNFVKGDGVKKPEGFTINPEVLAAAFDASGSSTFSADDIIELAGALKVGYNPYYGFNRQTLAFIRTLKDGLGGYLWQPGLNGAPANTLNGLPYLVMQDMDDNGTNGNHPVVCGDFRRGYTIVDRTGMSVIRDDYTRKDEAIVEFNLRRWNSGQVILPEAIKLMKIVS